MDSGTYEGSHLHDDDMVLIPGGEMWMGTDDVVGIDPRDGEGPARKVFVSSFWMDKTEITNRMFSAFVEATGYKTETEEFGYETN